MKQHTLAYRRHLFLPEQYKDPPVGMIISSPGLNKLCKWRNHNIRNPFMRLFSLETAWEEEIF